MNIRRFHHYTISHELFFIMDEMNPLKSLEAEGDENRRPPTKAAEGNR
jgi:hypothetical protein